MNWGITWGNSCGQTTWACGAAVDNQRVFHSFVDNLTKGENGAEHARAPPGEAQIAPKKVSQPHPLFE